MAQPQGYTHRKVNKVQRPRIHAKSKTSKMKGSKLYKKPYKGQG